MAQEKSSRSLMLTLMDVFCSTAPVCSATFMNRLLNSSSNTGSGRPLPAAVRAGKGEVRRSVIWSSRVISAVQPGSTTVVALASRISAGPAIRSPASSAVRSNTGASWVSPPEKMPIRSIDSGSPVSRAASVASCTVSPGKVASTATASTTSGRSGVAKPKRARCAR